ncbi:MAG: hypothetical protein ACI9U0_001723 [Flavobacteriales bacterium]
MHSMSIALTEDFINLIVVNSDDVNFELQELTKDKSAFRVLITKEFLKLNSGSVMSELKTMDEGFTSNMEKKKNLKSSQKKLKL